jgi:hypothetical protein
VGEQKGNVKFDAAVVLSTLGEAFDFGFLKKRSHRRGKVAAYNGAWGTLFSFVPPDLVVPKCCLLMLKDMRDRFDWPHSWRATEAFTSMPNSPYEGLPSPARLSAGPSCRGTLPTMNSAKIGLLPLERVPHRQKSNKVVLPRHATASKVFQKSCFH